MRTKTLKPSTVNVITLGCSKNIVDSEVLMNQLSANQFTVSHESPLSSETVIINTCGFIENAKEESIQTILKYSQLKDEGKIDRLIVTGCLSERYKADLENEIPQVDAYFGTRDLPRLLKFLNADYKKELLGERLLATPSHYAFLKISEGCNRPCSFCAIPLMRGKHVSKTVSDILDEAKRLAEKGVKELILIAQDLTSYGVDLEGKRTLANLLEKLASVSGIEWIRLQYAYPSQFPLEILDVMRDHPTVCKYLDMPLQHISDLMLKAMRRGITKRRTLELLDTIRKNVPGIALRTTLICGYPGESDADFSELLHFVQDQQFERLGVFTYSHEENTSAYHLEDNIPYTVKAGRADQIMAQQRAISLTKNKQKIGETLRVMIDRKEGPNFVGRTAFDSPEVDNEVLIDAVSRGRSGSILQIGQIYPVKIFGAGPFDLMGEPA